MHPARLGSEGIGGATAAESFSLLDEHQRGDRAENESYHCRNDLIDDFSAFFGSFGDRFREFG